jgi:hypothetical protein
VRSILLATLLLSGCGTTSRARRPIDPNEAVTAAAAAIPPPADLNAGGPRDELDKNTIVAGMKRTQPALRSCVERGRVWGLWSFDITILNDGHLRLNHITQPERDDATTACVAAVLPLVAVFPRFTGQPHTIRYPMFFR